MTLCNSKLHYVEACL